MPKSDRKIKLPVVGYLDEFILEEISIFLLEMKALRGASEVTKAAWMKERVLASK